MGYLESSGHLRVPRLGLRIHVPRVDAFRTVLCRRSTYVVDRPTPLSSSGERSVRRMRLLTSWAGGPLSLSRMRLEPPAINNPAGGSVIAPRAILRGSWRCAAWLAVGLVITVAVSWGLAAWMPQDMKWDSRWRGVDTIRDVVPAMGVQRTLQRSNDRTKASFRVSMGYLDHPKMVLVPSAEQLEHATGWPLLALRYRVVRPAAPMGTGEFEVRGGLWIPTNSRRLEDIRALPLIAMWPGVAYNSALWGAAAFGVVHGLRGGRATLRRRRGQCPACAYDLKGDPTPGCPECGWNRPPSPTPQVVP